MRKLSLFIAMSLDGYIADSSGGVNWLNGQDENVENIDSYAEFIKDIDTVIMGYNTYHQITRELSPDNWVYDDLKSYVITHRKIESLDNIIFTDENPKDLVNKLKVEDGKGIWLCGGASIVKELMKEDLIDEYYITIIPTILGSGIRLFNETISNINLRLIKTQTYNGIVDLVYTRR